MKRAIAKVVQSEKRYWDAVIRCVVQVLRIGKGRHGLLKFSLLFGFDCCMKLPDLPLIEMPGTERSLEES